MMLLDRWDLDVGWRLCLPSRLHVQWRQLIPLACGRMQEANCPGIARASFARSASFWRMQIAAGMSPLSITDAGQYVLRPDG